MDITMSTDLNKCFEILGLIYICRHPEFGSKEYLVKAAYDYGINGDELYNKLGTIHERYISAFKKKFIESQDNDFDFFDDEDNEFILFLQTVYANNSHWLDNIENISEEEIVLTLLNAIAAEQVIDDKPSMNEMIALLRTLECSPNVCWKLMLLMQDPKKQIERLTYIIRDNITAYENAVLSIEKPLSRLLNDFPKVQYKITSFEKGAVINPVLIYPAVEMMHVCGNGGYVGLFTKDVYKMMERQKNSRENLLPALKALSDKSKFDILVSLKNSPKYNLELAEQLGLSAATVSHHMNVLLTYDLVTVEKRDGRVYYTLVKDEIDHIITQLKYIFTN